MSWLAASALSFSRQTAMNLPAIRQASVSSGEGTARSGRTVDQAKNARRLLLLVRPRSTLADDRLGPDLERFARLERLILLAILGNLLVRVGVSGPVNFLKLALPAEDDEVVAARRETAGGKKSQRAEDALTGERDDARNQEQAGDELEAVRIVDVGEVCDDILRRLERLEALDAEVLEESEEFLRVADRTQDLLVGAS